MMYASLATIVTGETGPGLGSGLWHEYTKFDPMPTNASYAQTVGWYPDAGSSCIAGLGIKYSQTSNGPSKEKPVSLYFTPAGQVSGVGTVAFGKLSGAVVDQGYWQSASVAGEADAWQLDLGFRSPQAACLNTLSKLSLGDRAVINPGSVARALPLVQKGAIAEGYETGSCIPSMGTHSFYDLVGKNGSMTWKSPNLMPVVPMYDGNADWKLNAIFFTTPIVQQSSAKIPPAKNNQWEPGALNALPSAIAPFPSMCANWCDKNCGWKDTTHWSTMHIYFFDPHKVTCQGACSTHESTTDTSNDRTFLISDESTTDTPNDRTFLISAVAFICATVLIYAAVRARRSTKDAALF